MTIEALPRYQEITDTGATPTPILDSIIPPSDSVEVKSTRAMLLRLGETAAGARMADLSKTSGPSVDFEVVEGHLRHSIGLFLSDVERAGYGVIYDQSGEVVSSKKLLDELATVTKEKALEARLEELAEQLARERAQIASTEAEIVRLGGVEISTSKSTVERRHFGAGAIWSFMTSLLR